MAQQDPTFLVAEDRDGKPALAGRRRLVDGLDDAIDAADQIGGTAFALEPIEKNPVPPVAAITHIGVQAYSYELPDDPKHRFDHYADTFDWDGAA